MLKNTAPDSRGNGQSGSEFGIAGSSPDSRNSTGLSEKINSPGHNGMRFGGATSEADLVFEPAKVNGVVREICAQTPALPRAEHSPLTVDSTPCNEATNASCELPEALGALKGYRNWVVWRWERRGDEWTKPPYQAQKPKEHASTNDPATWCFYREARAAVLAGHADGVGFVLTGTKFAAFDLDGCVSFDVNGAPIIDEKAKGLLDACGSYCEITPGGKGLRVIGYGRGDPVHSKRSQGSYSLEIYRQATRYITVSGHALRGYDLPIVSIDPIIERVRPYPEGARGDGARTGDEAEGGDGALVETQHVDFAHGVGRFVPRDFVSDEEREAAVAPDVLRVIREGVRLGERSEAFQRVIAHLYHCGFTAEDAASLLSRYPRGIAAKYRDRLTAEAQRSWNKVEPYEAQRLAQLLAGFLEWPEEQPTKPNPEDLPEASVETDDRAERGDHNERGGAAPGDAEATQFVQMIDPWAAYPVPPFPLDVLPRRIRAFVETHSRAIGCDPAALAMSAMSMFSGALDHRFSLQLTKASGFRVRPRLWVALVGDPSTKKSPALSAAHGPLTKYDGRIRSDYKLARAAYKGSEKAAQAKGEPPPPEPRKPPRYLTSDVTTEKLGDLLEDSERGILLRRDELAGWIGGMDKYGGAGKGMSSDRAFWLQAYDGGPYSIDRVGRGEVFVANLSASVIGGIQTTLLPNLRGLTADGLLQRFLPTMIGEFRFREDISTAVVDEDYGRLLRECVKLKPTDLRLTEAGAAVMEQLHRHLHDLERCTKAISPGFQGFVGKLAGLTGSLTLILHLIQDGDPQAHAQARVEAVTVERVERLTHDFILPHALAFYDGIEGGEGADRLRKIASYILTSGKARIRASDLTNNVRPLRGMGVPELNEALSPLVAGAWLLPDSASGSHQRTTTWRVNPSAATQFAARREQEECSKQALAELMNSNRRGRRG